MKRALIILLAVTLAILTACSGTEEPQQEQAAEQKTESAEESTEMKNITMTINGETADVAWEDNESVRALAELASEAPVTIDASLYGGFEQVGAIGAALPSNDVNIKTKPGDIVLYSGSNMVVFFGSNSWAYTMLGHIENKSADELAALLGADKVTITLTAE